MRLFLVRHGQSTANLEKRYMGQTDVPLTELGQAQAEAIRPILAPFTFDKVYTSDLQRAINTQKLALPEATDVVRLKILREVDVGELVGTPINEMPAPYDPLFPKHKDYSFKNGENFSMVRERAQAFLDEVLASGAETVAAFSHFGFLCCLTQLMLDTEIANGHTPIDNCGIVVLEHDGTKWRLLAWNSGKTL